MALSTRTKRAITRRESGEPVLMLLTIEHPDLASPLRLVTNTVGDDILSNGNIFTAAPFQIEWPSDDEEAPTAKLRAFNVDRVVGLMLESIVTPAECTLQVVLATSASTIDREGKKFQLRNAQWDGGEMTADLGQAYFAAEPWPKYRVTPRLFPSLFR
jgi:hypothetical protein